MNKEFDTLYARDSKGGIVQWKAKIINNNTVIDIMFSYGQYKGNQAIRWRRDIQGKNIGKANETNSWEQAIKDVESQITSKKRKGYMSLTEIRENQILPVELMVNRFKELTNDNRDLLLLELRKGLPEYRTDLSGDIKPMKCQQYYRSKANWTAPDGTIWDDRKYYYLKNPHVVKESGAIITKFPCMAQPKINGVRCIIKLIDNKVSIKSKEGLEYNISHINDFLTLNNDIFSCDSEEIILDGELYIHGESLQTISSAVKKFNMNTPRLVFVLFDLAILENTNIERWQIIKEYIRPKLVGELNCPIKIINTFKISDDESAQIITDRFIQQGYEGSIFRDFDATYQFGQRKVNITKFKRCISAEFTIVDIIPQAKDTTMGNFVCITDEGNTFEVNPKGTEDYKREVLENRISYIGKKLTIDFYEWTDDRKPLHVINNLIRDYE
jgi:hypothetical protein